MKYTLSKDARVAELQLLSILGQSEKTVITKSDGDSLFYHLVRDLFYRGLLGGLSSVSININEMIVTDSYVVRPDIAVRDECWKAIRAFSNGGPVFSQVSHQGHLRISELQQALENGWRKDAFGILFDQSHTVRGIEIALAVASTLQPICLLYADMNGLRKINESGHLAGDNAIKAFFEVVDTVVHDKGWCFRDGGDEVVIVYKNANLDDGVELARQILTRLDSEPSQSEVKLSASIGVISTGDSTMSAKSLREQADRIQKSAKDLSRLQEPRCSAINVHGRNAPELIKPT